MAEAPTSPESRRCSACGTEIPNEAPGRLCPVCLLNAGAAFSGPESPSGSPPHPDGEDFDGLGAKDADREAAKSARSHREPCLTVEELRPLFPDLEILDLIGLGGMGAVYRTRQPRLDRIVALKVLNCQPEHHEHFSLRFEREARVLAKLAHPHIVTIFDFGEIGSDVAGGDGPNLFWFLMEYVDGTDLSQLIQAKKLTPDQALTLVPQICAALQFAHGEGITHRDVKPANILIDLKGQVKMADFGLARLLDGETDELMNGITQTGTCMGTPHYMAPEQWETTEEVDHRADIYSLGVVIYEMLTGERPLGVFDPPSRKVEVDVRIDSVVLKAMEREPGRRYQRADALSEEVTRIVNTPQSPRIRRHSAAGIGAALLTAIALLAVGGWWFLREAEKGGGPGPTLGDPSTESAKPPERKALREGEGRPRSESAEGEENPGLELDGFAYIPGGSFTMGRTSGDMDVDAPPITVTLGGFYLAKTETTKARWDLVRTWGLENGYSDLAAGAGKGADHPVHSLNWWEVVKWSNARSEMEGLAPVYHVAGAVMKTGETAPTADWSANGYRLPTEAEWEKAARGGVESKRYPWGGETINHDDANYRASGSGSVYSYDTSSCPDGTFHPDYQDKVVPFTAPVGSFVANGFGLHDMAGNVWEWTWDWFQPNYYHQSDGTSDPRGPQMGWARVRRGGSWWGENAARLRCGNRNPMAPGFVSDDLGFRSARNSVP